MKSILQCFIAITLTSSTWSQVSQPEDAEIPATLAKSIYKAQQTQATCWAACNSMLLAAEGIQSDEADQVRRMSRVMPSSGLSGAGAHFAFASQALGGKYGTQTIVPWFLDRRIPPVDPQMNEKFVDLIRQGKPVMVATPQHGMVAIAVRFRVHPNGFYELLKIKVLDPNPQVGGARWLPLQELQALFGFMAIP